jgi:hypothetical protein
MLIENRKSSINKWSLYYMKNLFLDMESNKNIPKSFVKNTEKSVEQKDNKVFLTFHYSIFLLISIGIINAFSSICDFDNHHKTMKNDVSVCNSINYQKHFDTNNNSLIPNTPTPTLTGECGSRYAFNSDNLTFSSHVTNFTHADNVVSSSLNEDHSIPKTSGDLLFANNFTYNEYELFSDFSYSLKDTFGIKIKPNLLKSIKNKDSNNTLQEQVVTMVVMGPNKDATINDDYYLELHLINKNTLEESIVKKTMNHNEMINVFSNIAQYVNIKDNKQYNYFSTSTDAKEEYAYFHFVESSNKDDFKDYVENFQENTLNQMKINNFENIIASPLGRFNAWKSLKNSFNNYNYWYKINKDGNISQFLLDQSTQPIVYVNLVREDKEHKIVHIIWLQRMDNDINGIINIHDALIIMPNMDFKNIYQNLQHQNYTVKNIITGKETEMNNWNQLKDNEIKDMANKMFLNNSLEQIEH